MTETPIITLDEKTRRPLIQMLVDATLYAFHQGTEAVLDGEDIHANCEAQFTEQRLRAEAAELRVSRLQADLVRAREDIERLREHVPGVWVLASEHDHVMTRLAAIEAAKTGEPPIPGWPAGLGCPEEAVHAVGVISHWGRQGWDAAAALRVELAEAQAHIVSWPEAEQTGVLTERKRIREALWPAVRVFLLADRKTVQGYSKEVVDQLVGTSVSPVNEVHP